MSAISLMSAPAANTFSPPYTMIARTSESAAAAPAAARNSSWTCVFSAFIGGRSSRMVPMPSLTSSRTNSPTWVTSSSTVNAKGSA
jgi:hypothetical protein